MVKQIKNIFQITFIFTLICGVLSLSDSISLESAFLIAGSILMITSWFALTIDRGPDRSIFKFLTFGKNQMHFQENSQTTITEKTAKQAFYNLLISAGILLIFSYLSFYLLP